MNIKQKKLLDFVIDMHEGQERKYTGEPYWKHPLEVSKIVSEFVGGFSIEVALCHDLLEDTRCNFRQLYKSLIHYGYERRNAYDICTMVVELTDVFTHENYPHLNRKKRKQLESERLGKISSIAQSVKYADLIDNTKSIVEHDKNFSKVYLEEKKVMLEKMTIGNDILFNLCKKQIEKS